MCCPYRKVEIILYHQHLLFFRRRVIYLLSALVFFSYDNIPSRTLGSVITHNTVLLFSYLLETNKLSLRRKQCRYRWLHVNFSCTRHYRVWLLWRLETNVSLGENFRERFLKVSEQQIAAIIIRVIYVCRRLYRSMKYYKLKTLVEKQGIIIFFKCIN